MSDYSEDDVRRAADTREWLIKQISDKQEELDRLRTMLSLVDSLLKQGSFRAAAAIGPTPEPKAAPPAATATRQQQAMTAAAPSRPPAAAARQASLESGNNKEVRPLKRAKDDLVLANAEITPGAVTITPAAGIALNANTPPFRSFFLNRILEGMKDKDAEKVAQGAIKDAESISYRLEEDAGGAIKKITISNYRDKDRLQEIFNTSAWVFTRMLEKAGTG
jgi:ParB-like chromosome segregation protein Spo0J